MAEGNSSNKKAGNAKKNIGLFDCLICGERFNRSKIPAKTQDDLSSCLEKINLSAPITIEQRRHSGPVIYICETCRKKKSKS